MSARTNPLQLEYSKPAVTGDSVFTGVANGQWYALAIAWAATSSIVNGHSNGRFGPDKNIPREQLAVMLWQYAGTPDTAGKEFHFADLYVGWYPVFFAPLY